MTGSFASNVVLSYVVASAISALTLLGFGVTSHTRHFGYSLNIEKLKHGQLRLARQESIGEVRLMEILSRLFTRAMHACMHSIIPVLVPLYLL